MYTKSGTTCHLCQTKLVLHAEMYTTSDTTCHLYHKETLLLQEIYMKNNEDLRLYHRAISIIQYTVCVICAKQADSTPRWNEHTKSDTTCYLYHEEPLILHVMYMKNNTALRLYHKAISTIQYTVCVCARGHYYNEILTSS